MATFIYAPNIPNVFRSRTSFIHTIISDIRKNGVEECWILNKQYMEIYNVKAIRISEFDVEISLYNTLLNEFIIKSVFVLHMKDHILEFFNEVPGTIFQNKLECFRKLYEDLNVKLGKTKNKKRILELEEKIDFIETTFPQLLI